MIVFDLCCRSGHVFEAWFASSASYDEQRERRLLRCAVCDDDAIDKAVMAPNVATKGNRAGGKADLRKLAAAQAALLETSEWVGDQFPERARAIHLGDAPAALIHGQASIDEVRSLVDDGVPIAPLPLPVVPPSARN